MNPKTIPTDLKDAWQRVKADADSGRSFVQHPYLRSWLETDVDTWLANLASSIAAGYSPNPAALCWVPKPGFMLRPGTILTIEDEVVFSYLVGAMHARIWGALKATQGAPDVAYEIKSATINNKRWLQSGSRCWRRMRARTLEILQQPEISHVVITDITGFYENIDHDRLVSDLRDIGVENQLASTLRRCLSRWSGVRRKGIPQGYSPSDLLAKVYLNNLDRTLQNEGYIHLRYVDDIRIFCRSQQDARKAILRVSELVSTRGLNLQSAKTKVLTKNGALKQFEGVGQVLAAVTEQLKAELLEGAAADPYATSDEIFEALGALDSEPPEVLERTFREQFSLAGSTPFNSTLFHFLIFRLAAARSQIAVPYCIELLRERPEETSYVLDYFRRIELTSEDTVRMIDFVGSSDAIYDYQIYQILRWFFGSRRIGDRLVQLSRAWAFDTQKDPWLRGYAVAYLGLYGERSDLESLESRYATLTTDVERATFAEALRRLELERRTVAFEGMRNDGYLVQLAVRAIENDLGGSRGES